MALGCIQIRIRHHQHPRTFPKPARTKPVMSEAARIIPMLEAEARKDTYETFFETVEDSTGNLRIFRILKNTLLECYYLS